MEAILHNPGERRFETQVGGDTAVADYRIEGDKMVFTHTFVPPAGRGKGVAAELVNASLLYAREQKLTPVPQCSYVVTFLQRHPEYLE